MDWPKARGVAPSLPPDEDVPSPTGACFRTVAGVQSCGSRVDMMVSMILPQVHLTSSSAEAKCHAHTCSQAEAERTLQHVLLSCTPLGSPGTKALPPRDYLSVGADYILGTGPVITGPDPLPFSL